MTATPLQRAIDKLGSQAKLARAIGRSTALVSYWLQGQLKIHPEDAVKIERVTEGQVTRAELRPDIFT